jgi:hypothetical protein
VTGVVVATEHEADVKRLGQLLVARGNAVEISDGSLLIKADSSDPRAIAAEVSRTAASEGLALVELHVERMNLEERYLAIMNGGPE